MAVGQRLVKRVCLPDVVSHVGGVRLICAAEQHGAVHMALAVAHDLHAPHLLQPLCASDCDVVDVRTVVRVERDKASGHTWPMVDVPVVETLLLTRSGKEF